MKIAITGGTSAIGVNLINRLNELGHATFSLGGRNSEIWKLGQKFPSEIEADALVHLAHDRSLSFDENLQAAQVLCESFHGQKLFLSSFSAHSKSLSKYGKSKFAIEKIFAKSNGCSLRAGIVWGEGSSGFFSKLENGIRRTPVVLVPYKGLPVLFSSHIEDLVTEIIFSLENPGRKLVFAANTTPFTLYFIINIIALRDRQRKFLLPLAGQPLELISRLLIRLMPKMTMLDSLLSISSEASYEEIAQLDLPHTMFRNFVVGQLD